MPPICSSKLSAATPGEHLKWLNQMYDKMEDSMRGGGVSVGVWSDRPQPQLSVVFFESSLFLSFLSRTSHILSGVLYATLSFEESFQRLLHTQKTAFTLQASDERRFSRGWENRLTEQFGSFGFEIRFFLFYFVFALLPSAAAIAIGAPSTGRVMVQQGPSVLVLANYVADEA